MNDARPHDSVESMQLVSRFLSAQKEGTKRAYSGSLKSFTDFMGLGGTAQNAEQLLYMPEIEASQVVLRYREHLLERGLSPATVQTRLSALRCLVHFAKEQGVVGWELNVVSPSLRPRGASCNVLPSMLKSLPSSVRGGKAVVMRDQAIVALLSELALRRSELVALELQDFQPTEHSLRFKPKGNSTFQTSPVSLGLKQILCNWIEVRGNDPGPLFVNLNLSTPRGRLTGNSVRKMIARLSSIVGVPLNSRDLRRAAMMHALEGHIDLVKAREFMTIREPSEIPTY